MTSNATFNGNAAPARSGAAYPITDHTFDVVVVGHFGVKCGKRGIAILV